VTHAQQPVPHERFLALLKKLRVAATPTGPARHQPITVMWAMGRAAQGKPRLTPWAACADDLRTLLREYGQPDSRPRPEFPVLPLARTDLWDIQGHTGGVPPAHGEPRSWMDENNPSFGLAIWAYDLTRDSAATRAAAIEILADRLFDNKAPDELLVDSGLLTPS
jgi:5-methylcytosine-specific restriction protein A